MRLSLLIPLAVASLWACGARAGELRPRTAVLRSNVDQTTQQTAIEFCDDEKLPSTCRPLGRKAGYSQGQWQEIRSLCEAEADHGLIWKYVGETLGFVAGTYTAGPIGGIAMANILQQVTRTPGEIASIRAGSDGLPAVLGDDQEFRISIQQMVDILNGIDLCLKSWEAEQSPRYKRWNNGWARPLG